MTRQKPAPRSWLAAHGACAAACHCGGRKDGHCVVEFEPFESPGHRLRRSLPAGFRRPARPARAALMSSACDGACGARLGRGDATRLPTRQLRGGLDAAGAAARRLARRGAKRGHFKRRATFVVRTLGQVLARGAHPADASGSRADRAVDAVCFRFFRLRLAAGDLLFGPVPFSFGCHAKRIRRRL